MVTMDNTTQITGDVTFTNVSSSDFVKAVNAFEAVQPDLKIYASCKAVTRSGELLDFTQYDVRVLVSKPTPRRMFFTFQVGNEQVTARPLNDVFNSVQFHF